MLRATSRRFLLAGMGALLAACATGPRSIDVSTQQIQSALQRRFPYELRPAGLFGLRLEVPRLQLLPEQNRLRLDFPVEASDPRARGTRRAELGLSFGLRYEASDASIRAADVRLDAMELQAMPPEWRAPLQLAGGLAAERMLEGTVLHTFRPGDLQRARGWRPGAIRVTPTGLHMELLPPS